MLCGHVTKVLLLFTDVPERCLSAFFGYLSIGDVSRLGAFAMRLLLLLSACVDGFPVLRLLRPIRHFPRASGVSRDVALSLLPTTCSELILSAAQLDYIADSDLDYVRIRASLG